MTGTPPAPVAARLSHAWLGSSISLSIATVFPPHMRRWPGWLRSTPQVQAFDKHLSRLSRDLPGPPRTQRQQHHRQPASAVTQRPGPA